MEKTRKIRYLLLCTVWPLVPKISFLKQTYKILPAENYLIWSFVETRFVYISIKILTKNSKLLKNSKYWGLKKTETSYEQWFDFADHQYQNILLKVRKQAKLDKTRKFDICLCVSFKPYCQKLIFGGENKQTLTCVSTQFWDSLLIY